MFVIFISPVQLPYWISSVYDRQVSPSLVNIMNPLEHAKRRKIWNRAFNANSLKEYEQILNRRSRELVDELLKRKGDIVDISKWMEYFAWVHPSRTNTLQVQSCWHYNSGSISWEIWRMCIFSMWLNHTVLTSLQFWFLLRNDEVRYRRSRILGDADGFGKVTDSPTHLRRKLTLVLRFVTLVSHVPWVLKLLKTLIGPTGAAIAIFRVADKMVSQRMQGGSTTRDLFYHLVCLLSSELSAIEAHSIFLQDQRGWKTTGDAR